LGGAKRHGGRQLRAVRRAAASESSQGVRRLPALSRLACHVRHSCHVKHTCHVSSTTRTGSGADECQAAAGGAATSDRALQYGMASDDCTDVLLLTDDVAAVGHNEDADYSIVDNCFLVHMHSDSGVAFTAYTYAGELPSIAFAFNSARMGFSMDAVPPAPSEVVRGASGATLWLAASWRRAA
ncbi:hypothetical protein CLOM_g3886, partial [Closterium sp. NIES-68]